MICPRCFRQYDVGARLCAWDGATLVEDLPDHEESQQLPAGKLVGDYEIVRLLGEGGMGEVYLARQPIIGRDVAIKVLKSTSQDAVGRFIREARAMAKLRHKNVVDIYTFGKLADGRPYFVMEYLQGMSLETWLHQKGRVSLAQALPILREVADTLDVAHAAKMVHRDLKPANIFLALEPDQTLHVKLLDFGLVKVLKTMDNVEGQTTAVETRAGAILGTPRYMAPECFGDTEVDYRRADLYSLGVVAYQMLTGNFPHRGRAFGELVANVLLVPAALPSSFEGVQEALDTPLLRAIHRDPLQRYERASGMVAALEKVGRGPLAESDQMGTGQQGAIEPSHTLQFTDDIHSAMSGFSRQSGLPTPVPQLTPTQPWPSTPAARSAEWSAAPTPVSVSAVLPPSVQLSPPEKQHDGLVEVELPSRMAALTPAPAADSSPDLSASLWQMPPPDTLGVSLGGPSDVAPAQVSRLKWGLGLGAVLLAGGVWWSLKTSDRPVSPDLIPAAVDSQQAVPTPLSVATAAPTILPSPTPAAAEPTVPPPAPVPAPVAAVNSPARDVLKQGTPPPPAQPTMPPAKPAGPRQLGKIVVGSPLPRVAGLTLEAQALTLEQILKKGGTRGGLVQLWASWCGPCVSELRQVKAGRHKLEAGGVQVLLVNVMEDRGLVQTTLTDLELGGFPNILDSTGVLVGRLGLKGGDAQTLALPVSVVVDSQGVVVRIFNQGSADYVDEILGSL